MTTAALPPVTRPRAEWLDDAADAVRRQRQAQVDLLRSVAAYVATAPLPEQADGGVLFGEQVVQLAGDGAPLVAEFAPLEIGARLGWSIEAARTLVGQALELAFRLPRFWAHVEAGRVPPRLAQSIAELSVILTADQAERLDRKISAAPRDLGIRMADRLIEEIRLYDDPDLAVGREEALLADRHVRLIPDRQTPAATRVEMLLDHDEAKRFDTAVSDVAAQLAALGDGDSLDVRRAKAVGVLADPQTALDLLQHGVMPTRQAPSVNLYLHLTDDVLTRAAAGTPGPVEVEGLSVVTTDLIRRWLDAPDVRINVRPVITIPAGGKGVPPRSPGWEPVDRHDPPDAMREVVILRDRECVAPGCHRSSRWADLDHITEYVDPDDGGPPGQTHPGNLAPLCRTHHRFKTHSSWNYGPDHDGSFTWTSPTGLEITTR